jgi:predicted RNA-binding Zn-ribbon protein involved in translation (DUF1610 family)
MLAGVAKKERRSATRCPVCGSSRVKKETTIKGRVLLVVWRCSACGAATPERRRR